MKATTLITATLLTLGLSSASLEAQRRDNRYPDRDRRTERYDGRRVETLAHEVEEVARSIRYTAERNNRRPDRREARVLAELRELNDRAGVFHSQVEGYRQEPRRTERDFEALLNSFYSTSDLLRTIERRSYIDNGMDRIAGLLGELSRYYGRDEYGRWGKDRGWRGYGHRDRYGRNRSDDRQP
jgi:hypothetical protein